MVLNDVWRTIGNDVSFFYEKNFDEVPALSGVYAWFYPLRILSRESQALEQFVLDTQKLLNYDSTTKGIPMKEGDLPVTWWSWSVTASRKPKPPNLSGSLNRAWTEIISSEEYFTNFQQTLLKASIFMPPLYVGKANNLNIRCGQHRLGNSNSSSDFHNRFQDFACGLNLRVRSVNDLIFACVRTGSPLLEEESSNQLSPVHELVEAVMNSICAPPYGKR
jgi:hypothetical protein